MPSPVSEPLHVTVRLGVPVPLIVHVGVPPRRKCGDAPRAVDAARRTARQESSPVSALATVHALPAPGSIPHPGWPAEAHAPGASLWLTRCPIRAPHAVTSA